MHLLNQPPASATAATEHKFGERSRGFSPAWRRAKARAGVSLVEVVIAFGIFTVLAGGVVGSFIQARKYSESNLSQAYAHSMAQAILEELIRVPANVLSDTTVSAVTIKLARLTDQNYTAMDDFTLTWATDDTTFQEIGTTDAGILTDAAYIANSNTIRPERFMRMRLNLQRVSESNQNRVRIILRYQWEVPDRRAPDGGPLFLSGGLRTVRSTALRF